MKWVLILAGAVIFGDLMQGALVNFGLANMTSLSDYALAALVAVIVSPWVHTRFQ